MQRLILNALRQEGHVSGERLGKQLNISRTAIWKHINRLRQKGYQITPSPRLGYSFVRTTDRLLPEEISSGLGTHLIGKHVVYHEEVTSTQDVAEELAKQGAADGTVVIAEEQTKGRGRMGRNWVSPAGGGVYLSIILRPNLTPAQVLQIPLIAAVAASKAIKRVTPLQPKVKWPNDIILGGRKVGGILTETSAEIDRVNYIILGIGINVNTPRSLLPESVRGLATSLAEECGEYVPRVRFVQHLLTEFEALYHEFLVSGFARVREEWKALDNTIGATVKVSTGTDEVEGEALDIDGDGFLLVKTIGGEVKRIICGDVQLRNLSC